MCARIQADLQVFAILVLRMDDAVHCQHTRDVTILIGCVLNDHHLIILTLMQNNHF